MSIAIRAGDNFVVEIDFDRSEVYPPSHYAKNFVRILSEQPLSGMTVLDAGCGTGVLGIAAAKLGATVTCSDLNPGAIRWAEINAEKNNVSIHCVQSEGIDEFVGRSKFDLVVCNAPSNPGTYNPVVTPRDNGPDGRQFLDSVLVNAPKILRRNGRLPSCSKGEHVWNTTRDILNTYWASYRIVADLDEDFSGLDQFSEDQLKAWVQQGHCWTEGDVTVHNVRYFFAYH